MQFTQGPVDGALVAPQQLSAAGVAAGGAALAANAAGDVAVVFQEDFVARAAVQPAGGTMGAPETIDTGDADAITVDVVPSGSGRFIAAVETGVRAKSSRQVRISTFAP